MMYEDNVIAWLFPNTNDLTVLDAYMVSVAEIEAMINDGLGPIPIPQHMKNERGNIDIWRC
jgi:hypothetical protein